MSHLFVPDDRDPRCCRHCGRRAEAHQVPAELTCATCGSEQADEECTNPFCAEWRFGAAFDEVTR